jgi:hypothetical protein
VNWRADSEQHQETKIVNQIDVHELADEERFNRFYPMAVRWTGLSWALGIGRTSAIPAPIAIGILVGMKLSLQQSLIATSIPAVLGMLAVLVIDHRRSMSAHHHDASAALADAFDPVFAARQA